MPINIPEDAATPELDDPPVANLPSSFFGQPKLINEEEE